MLLKNKVVIVTGAGRNMGQEFALGLSAFGASIVAADIIDTAETVEKVTRAGGNVIGIHVDVADLASTEAMAKTAYGKYGRIDGLVNNAAIYGALQIGTFEDITVEEWDKVMAVNVKGVWLAARAAYTYMKGQGSGSIVNLSSSAILLGNPLFPQYVASKGAVWSLTRSMSRTAGKYNVRVNSVSPGMVMTEASKELGSKLKENADADDADVVVRAVKRPQNAADVVGTVAFLLSDLSEFITGQNLNVDGGGRHY
ncbi:MAG: SDR family oxidoreductase [Clostridiales Family XIII bacterium]|nr:SDR family oxidoreductase [Clostridiales Family XIII bacterium]